MSHLTETQIAEILQLVTQQSLANKEHLNLKDAALYMGISESYLYKLTSSRQITFYRPGAKLIYFLKTDLDKWIVQKKEPSLFELTAFPKSKRA